MIKRKAEMSQRSASNMRGGTGEVQFLDLMAAETESLGKMRICSEITLEKGASIGRHDHVGEAELYIITKGIATVDDDGESQTLRAGDIIYTGGGAFHAIENAGDEPLVFYAIVIN